MGFFGTRHQHPRRETQRASEAEAGRRLVSEKATSSPRVAIAFSALSAVTWLREKIGGLFGRVPIGMSDECYVEPCQPTARRRGTTT